VSPSKKVQLLVLIGVLCIGATLQMLGVSMSFWDLEGWSDTVIPAFCIASTSVLFRIDRESYHDNLRMLCLD